jgi:hypothetical protein
MMKIALTRRNSERINTTSRYSIHNKEDLSNQDRKLVSIFAARWRSIRKYFSGQTTWKTKQEKATVVRKHHTHLYSERKPKETLKQSSQNRYNPHFNLNKQAYTQHEAALQKEQRMPRATL